jgi:hypothetical protein
VFLIKKFFRHRIFILFLLLCCAAVPALARGETDPEQSTGKLFLYTAKRLGIPILKASLYIGNGSSAAKKSIYRIRVEIVSVNVSLLFRMNNRFTSKFDGNSGFPLEYVKEIDQSGIFIKNKNYIQTLTFDSLHNKVLVEKKGENEKQEVSVPRETFDPLSMFARWYLKEGLPMNQEIRMSIFDGIKVKQIIVNPRLEWIKSNLLGEVEAVCLESSITFTSFEEKEGTLRIWYSHDPKRIPLRMELELPVGKIQFELDEIRETKRNKS